MIYVTNLDKKVTCDERIKIFGVHTKVFSCFLSFDFRKSLCTRNR